jgi:ribosome-binding factor A
MGEPIRVGRVREKIKADVAQILQHELKDPRMGFVTVISCDLAHDYRTCEVRVSVLADKDSEVRNVMRMLDQARGYVQKKVASRLRTRVAPVLTFVLDKGAERSVQMSTLLDDLKAEREAREAKVAAAGDGVAVSSDLGSEDTTTTEKGPAAKAGAAPSADDDESDDDDDLDDDDDDDAYSDDDGDDDDDDDD